MPILSIIIFFSIYGFLLVRNIICLWTVDRWLSNKSSLPTASKDSQTLFYLIIPMLNEQGLAKSTYMHFKKLVQDRPNFHVVFVTTEKEVPSAGLSHTRDMLVEIANKEPFSRVKLFHFPFTQGIMAHQLNYAVEQIRKEQPDGDFWIGIYNADSRIDGRVLDYVSGQAATVNYKNSCFQQYSWYPITRGVKAKSFIGSAALWQNRWSLTFEIPRVLFQLRFNSFLNRMPKPVKNILELLLEKMNYVIGHGLFIHAQTLQKAGSFPEDTINEDAFLGYLLNNERINIYPLPFLEEAEFAPNLDIYIRQQTTWFNGPWYAFQYFKYYLKGDSLVHPFRPKCKKDVYSISRAFILAVKLFCHSIYWLFSPLLLLIIFPASLVYFADWKVFIVWLVLTIAHLPLTHYFTRLVVTRHVQDPRKVSKASILFCIGFYFIHCLGPLRNLYRQLKGENTIHKKYKTEHQDVKI
ncbi:glycosyltransferase family protein [Risungbinella massiliensis]|uniref:glycosyltransferase family 2 protein n=1 Tax=Risungbinella massiliensis TaxID=1329796 RepID=UPI0005CBA63B|nr:glycosyltransferase family 2 protein [Risungbinella massiliensis]